MKLDRMKKNSDEDKIKFKLEKKYRNIEEPDKSRLINEDLRAMHMDRLIK